LGDEPKEHENVAAWLNALGAAREAFALQPRDPELTRALARCYRNLGDAYKYRNDRAAALESYQQALVIDERRAAADPGAAQPKMDLYWDLVPSGWVHHDAGYNQIAVSEFEWAARLLRQVCASDPDDYLARLELAKLLITAVPTWQALGREEDVSKRLAEALQCLEWARARDPKNLDAELHYGWALMELGDAWARRGRWQMAAENYAKSVAAFGAIPVGARFDEGIGPDALVARARSQLALCRSHFENLPPR
jgi:tetratricopeptide (TPR) repeat protein